MEIVAFLAARRTPARYLELCSSTTGNFYGELDRSIIGTAHRLMYNCPPHFEDGSPIDFRAEGLDSGACIAEIRSRGLRYDVILVDPFHEYETSYRDLCDAFDLIDDGGMLVVHDCLPPDDPTVVAPTFTHGAWWGVTYKAYLDFVGARSDLDYRTIDTDCGCGIIRKVARRSRWWQVPGHLRNALLWRQWRAIGDDFERAFRFFNRHKRSLLRLTDPRAFVKMG